MSAEVDAEGPAQPAPDRGPGRGRCSADVAPARCRRPSTTSPARSSTAPRITLGAHHDVGAVVHAVDEVDVEVTRRPEHHRGCAGCGHGRRASRGRRRRRTPRPRSGARTLRRGVSTAPSSRGATSSGVEHAQPSRTRWSALAATQLVELLAHPHRRRTAAAGARGDRALDGQHRRAPRASGAARSRRTARR